MVQNALTLYQKMPDPLAAIQTLGRDIAGSKMFGDLTVAQGNVFAMECLSRGIPPLMLAEEYDVIFGKLSRKASACLSNFHKSGGTSKILSRTPDSASVQLTLGADTQTFTLTWEAAQQETFPYEGKEKDILKALAAWKAGSRGAKQPELKPKYATPHSRMQMLWSRLIKDAVKAMTGDGMDASGDPESEIIGGDGDAVEVEYEVVKAEVKAEVKPAGTNGSKPAETAPAIQAPVPVTQASDQQQAVPFDTADKGEACLATPEQVASICGAMNQLGMSSEQRGKALHKRGVNEVPKLSYAAASELLSALNAKVDAIRKGALDAANGRTAETQTASETPAAKTRPDDGTPCSDVQVGQVKQLLGEIEQVSPGFNDTFKKRFWASGRQKIVELTAVECDVLIEQLKTKNLERYFADQLKPKAKPEAEPKN